MGRFERFSDAEISRIQDAFWAQAVFRELGKGTVHCPSCGSDCHVLSAKSIGYPKTLMATCHVCGKHSQFRSVAEAGPDLSEYDLKYFIGRHQGGLESLCRHCETPIHVEEVHGLGGTLLYELRCLRCGSFGRHRWR